MQDVLFADRPFAPVARDWDERLWPVCRFGGVFCLAQLKMRWLERHRRGAFPSIAACSGRAIAENRWDKKPRLRVYFEQARKGAFFGAG